MAEQLDSNRFAGAVGAEGSTPDRTLDHQAIFSGPGIEVVFHWWAESNRRWSEQNRAASNRLYASPARLGGDLGLA